jgi:4-carboxymuconolactone decarboxylase
MAYHFPRALSNGVSPEELVEMITHLAFYAGWPSASSAIAKYRELVADKAYSALTAGGYGFGMSK